MDEPGLEGVVINLFDDTGTFLTDTFTSSDGLYIFDDLEDGDYYIEVVIPEDFEITFDNEGSDDDLDSDIDGSNGPNTSALISVVGGVAISNLDIGLYQCVKIGELVWYDTNFDDIWNAEENGINGIDVNLYRMDNGTWILYDTEVTGHKPGTPSDDGYYKFCAPPGEYYLEIPIRPEYELVPVLAFQGSDPTRDSDFDDSNGPFTTPTYTFSSGEEDCTISAGFYPMALMGDYVWDDVNVNGIQDYGEDFFPGVTIEIYNEQGEMVGSDVSDQLGRFEMDYLQKKKYYIKVYPPNGYGFTTPNQGNDDEDSDIDGSNGNGTSALYQMNPGVEVLNVDVGLSEGALPLDLISFFGENKGEENHLFWKTANEINVDIFVVERSADNFDFFDIADVQIMVNNSAEKEYTFIDDRVKSGVLYYYRLRIVDMDGSYEYSNILSLFSKKKGIFIVEVYPVPSDRIIYINVENHFANKIQLKVYSINNSRLIETDIVDFDNNNTGNFKISKDFSNYTPGIYVLEIKAGNEVTRKRIIIVK